jgi:hypothetical protein
MKGITNSGGSTIENLMSGVVLWIVFISVMNLFFSCSKDDPGSSVTDTVAPKISSVDPASNSTEVPVSTVIKITFSELMDASTITQSAIVLKQNSTDISGTVTYSDKVAIFTPSSNLSAATEYTATVTIDVTDTAGNALASNHSWTFTTASSATSMSFASDVIPVLSLCNNCHTHGWTISSNSSTFYNNLVNGGYVSPSSYTSSKIYTKISAGHASSISSTNRNKILTWMSEGSKNN